MFRQAPRLAGIDAWRRIIRLINNGRGIRVEQLCNEMRMIRAYPIKAWLNTRIDSEIMLRPEDDSRRRTK